MKKRLQFSIALGIVLSIALGSCNKEGDTTGISAINVKTAEDNALRVKVGITFNAPCSYSITYWKKDTPEKKTTTNVYSSTGTEASAELMFLYANSTYQFHVNIENGSGGKSNDYEFNTASIPVDIPLYTVTEGADKDIPGYYFTTAPNAKYLLIADTDGNLVWYQHLDIAPRQFDVLIDEDRIWLACGYKVSSTGSFQRLVKYVLCTDFHGNELHKWNIAEGELDIPYVHHDIRKMPDGNIAVVCNQVRTFDLTPLGGQPDTEVYGDGFAVFNESGKVLKNWDIFDEIDVFTCPYVKPVKFSLDLVHANSVNWDSKGNYYMTFNRINQLWKIDAQTGKVLYRAGRDGNVTMDEAGFPYGIHSAVPLDEDRILFLDNGQEKQITRALIYKIDSKSMTGSVELDVALPQKYFATDRSNVELIRDNSMLFFGLTNPGYVVFTDLKGNILKAINREGISYRAHYLPELPKY